MEDNLWPSSPQTALTSFAIPLTFVDVCQMPSFVRQARLYYASKEKIKNCPTNPNQKIHVIHVQYNPCSTCSTSWSFWSFGHFGHFGHSGHFGNFFNFGRFSFFKQNFTSSKIQLKLFLGEKFLCFQLFIENTIKNKLVTSVDIHLFIALLSNLTET